MEKIHFWLLDIIEISLNIKKKEIIRKSKELLQLILVKKPAAVARGSVSKQLVKFQQMGVQKRKFAVTSKQASHLHKSIISSLIIKGKNIITTDISGFVKYWKL